MIKHALYFYDSHLQTHRSLMLERHSSDISSDDPTATLASLKLLERIDAVIRSHDNFARAYTARGSSSAPRPRTLHIHRGARVHYRIHDLNTRGLQDLAYRSRSMP
jgi:hypothetical protein